MVKRSALQKFYERKFDELSKDDCLEIALYFQCETEEDCIEAANLIEEDEEEEIENNPCSECPAKNFCKVFDIYKCPYYCEEED